MKHNGKLRWWSVSIGDGNVGVSHIFPDYHVKARDPWEVCELAARALVKPEFHNEIEIEGDDEFVQAALLDPEGEEAELLVDVFLADFFDVAQDASGTRCYWSLTEAFGE